MLLPFVTNAVLQDTWLSNTYGYNLTVSPGKVSLAGGVTTSVKAGKRYVVPPTTNNPLQRFHLYHIGQLPKHYTGMTMVLEDIWVNLEDLMKNYDVFVSVTLSNGAMVSPRRCWIRKFSIDNNIVVAIMNDPSFDLGTTVVYLGREEDRLLIPTEDGYPIPLANGRRKLSTLDNTNLTVAFYSNLNYFKGTSRNTDKVKTNLINYSFNQTNNDATIRSWLNGFKTNPKVGWVHVDGFIYTLDSALLDVNTLKKKELGVYTDRSIVYKGFFRFEDLKEYDPGDRRLRHIIQLPVKVGSIEDVSIFLGTGTNASFKGIHLNTTPIQVAFHLTDTLIALDDIQLNVLRTAQEMFDDRLDLHLYVVVRESARSAEIGLKTDRLDVLNSFTPTNRLRCVTGEVLEATMWQGAALEDSNFNKMRYMPFAKVTEQDVVDVYGYYGLEKLFQPQPVPVRNMELNGEGVCEFIVGDPFREPTRITTHEKHLDVLAYGSDRRLLRSKEYPRAADGNVTFNTDLPLAWAEYDLVYNNNITLKGHTKLFGDVFISERGKQFGFKCYYSTKNSNDSLKEDWKAAKEGTHYTLLKTSRDIQVKWKTAYMNGDKLVGCTVEGHGGCRYTRRFAELSNRREFIRLDVAKDVDGLKAIEPDLIQIWMDGYILIEGIDYIVKWDAIYIVKACLNEMATIHIRMKGLPQDGVHSKPLDIGFVDRGRICFDSSFIIHKGKNLQYSVNGLLYTDAEVRFGLDTIAGTMVGVEDGQPYQIQRRPHVLEHYINVDSVKERLKQDGKDEDILDAVAALNIYSTTYNRNTTSIPMNKRHVVISPLLNEIVYRFRVMNWLFARLEQGYEDYEAEEWLAPYLYLVEGDPTLSTMFNANFMVASPCAKVTKLSVKQVKFLHWVSRKYLKDKVNIDQFITT